MPTDATRRTFMTASAAVGGLALAGCITSEAEDLGYEVWALDQGKDNVYVYEPADEEDDDDDEFELVDDIDLNALEGVPDEDVVPHMIDYTEDYDYAVIACTAGARTLIFDTEERELVGNVETGAGSHFAGVHPDEEYIHVDVIGVSEIVRVEADFDDEEFEVVDRIATDADEIDALHESSDPICHQYDGNNRSIHTMGPSYNHGAVLVVDHDEFEVVESWSHDELPANCGTTPHPEEDKFYLTAGLPSNPEEDVEGVGEYYVLDTAEDEIVVEEESNGIDTHGFWFTPDGDELWTLNRETNDGLILDPETDEVIEEIDAFGPATGEQYDERDAPDIMWASPDGQYMFVTLRSPSPLSGGAHAATGVTPGFVVFDVEERERVGVVEPDPIEDYSEEEIEAARNEEEGAPRIPDFHGIGVAVTGDYDTDIPTSPPY